jgi:hypothetical protein
MGTIRCFFIVWLLLMVAPIFALADGTITAISPNPSPGVACQLNTIKISGTGTCTGIQFDLGDGTNIVNLPGTFPLWVYHTYKYPGTYTLKAQGKGNCTGAITTALQVVGPTITSIFPFSVIKPGGAVILQGQNLGNLPGQILIVFQNQLIGTNLTSIQWGNTFAAGTIPSDITGQPDQTVGLYVINSCGAASNHVLAKFTATRDLIALPYDQISCSSDVNFDNSNACQNNGNFAGAPPECGYLPPVGSEPPATGFRGWHDPGWTWPGQSTPSGNDKFQGPILKNGWGFDSASPLQGAGKYVPTYWNLPPIGGINPSFFVNWKCDSCNYIVYYGDILITGPIGVPYQ